VVAAVLNHVAVADVEVVKHVAVVVADVESAEVVAAVSAVAELAEVAESEVEVEVTMVSPAERYPPTRPILPQNQYVRPSLHQDPHPPRGQPQRKTRHPRSSS